MLAAFALVPVHHGATTPGRRNYIAADYRDLTGRMSLPFGTLHSRIFEQKPVSVSTNRNAYSLFHPKIQPADPVFATDAAAEPTWTVK